MINSILAEIRMEGFKFTKEEETLFHKIGNGELGVEEARKNYLFKIKKLSEERPEILHGAAESDRLSNDRTLAKPDPGQV